MGLRTKNNWLKMKDLWCRGAKTTGLNSTLTKLCKYTSEKAPLLFFI